MNVLLPALNSPMTATRTGRVRSAERLARAAVASRSCRSRARMVRRASSGLHAVPAPWRDQGPCGCAARDVGPCADAPVGDGRQGVEVGGGERRVAQGLGTRELGGVARRRQLALGRGEVVEGHAQRFVVPVVEGGVEERRGRLGVSRGDGVHQRSSRFVAPPLGPRERRAPPQSVGLASGGHDGPDAAARRLVRRGVREHRREQLARAGHVEHHGAEQRGEGARVARERPCPAADQRVATVGRGRVAHAADPRCRPRDVAPGEPRLGPAQDDVAGVVARDPVEPEAPPWRRRLPRGRGRRARGALRAAPPIRTPRPRGLGRTRHARRRAAPAWPAGPIRGAPRRPPAIPRAARGPRG